MKELEQWEKTQFILAGYKVLCANCQHAPVEKEVSETGVGLANHCVQCWTTKCYKDRNSTSICYHNNPIFLVP